MNPAQNNKPNGHIPELDGIRGVAIAMVLIFHYFYVPVVVTPGGLAQHVLAPLRLGWTGVDLFFVLSGFLIGGILLDARVSTNYFKTFYVRRFYRIVPLYALVLCACYILALAPKYASTSQFKYLLESPLPWFSYVFYVQNFWMGLRNTFGMPSLGLTWSLAIEEQFYMTLPLVIWLLEPRRLQNLLIKIVIAAPVIRTVLYFGWPKNTLLPYVLMPCRADALLLGVLAAIVMRNPTYRTWVEAHSHLVVGAILVLLSGCAVSIHKFSSFFSGVMQTFGYTWMAILYVLVLLYALTLRSSLVSRVFRWGLLRSLGKVAYGVYLLHGLVLAFVTGWISPGHSLIDGWPALDSWFQLGLTIFALLLTLGLCKISWLYFEKPLVQIGHRSKYRFDSSQPVPGATQLVSP